MRQIVLLATILALLMPLTAYAEKQLNKGLLITPPRQYLQVDPGKETKSSVTIANLTEEPVNVTLSVQQFSVADYTYDYNFEIPIENWIRLETTQVTLKKTESHTISYDVSVPANATPGGHYFTLFASMTLENNKKVQAATVVYVTVNGNLVKTNVVEKHALPLVSFGGDIQYNIDVRNTGNTHYLVYVSGKLHGFSAQPAQSDVAHILLPQRVRSIQGYITPPLIPGVYQADYGFKNEDGQETHLKQYILYAPFWSWLLILGIIWFIVTFLRRRRRMTRQTTTDS